MARNASTPPAPGRSCSTPVRTNRSPPSSKTALTEPLRPPRRRPSSSTPTSVAALTTIDQERYQHAHSSHRRSLARSRSCPHGRHLRRTARGLDRSLFQTLATCQWIREANHLVILGPTGTGKSWLACALGNKACRDGFSVLYKRAPRLFADLAQARGEGRLARLIAALERVNLLILDDWGPEPLTADQRRDLLEIVDDRYARDPC